MINCTSCCKSSSAALLTRSTPFCSTRRAIIPSTGTRGPCSQRRWAREEAIEGQLVEILGRLRLPQSFLDVALAKLRKCHESNATFSAALRRKLQGQSNDAQKRMDGLLQLKISPNNADGSMLSDEEYLHQKTRIKAEMAMLQTQMGTIHSQAETWVDDCEQFFTYTQELAKTLQSAGADQKRRMLVLICSSLALQDGKLTLEYKEPFASLARFPLAGVDEPRGFVLVRMLSEAENPEIVQNWLGIVIAIRTFPLLGAPSGGLTV